MIQKDILKNYLYEILEHKKIGSYTKTITGIGSRSSDPSFKKYKPFKNEELIRFIMINAGLYFQELGYSLRSGDAIGSDRYFAENFDDDRKEIYRPLNKLKNNTRTHIFNYNEEDWKLALEVIKLIHPGFSYLNDYSIALHARNVFQVLGSNLDNKSKFILAYTPDGAKRYEDCSSKTGGTGTAIKIADLLDIPVFNLSIDNDLERLLDAYSKKIDVSLIKKNKDDQLSFNL